MGEEEGEGERRRSNKKRGKMKKEKSVAEEERDEHHAQSDFRASGRTFTTFGTHEDRTMTRRDGEEGREGAGWHEATDAHPLRETVVAACIYDLSRQ